MSPSAWSRSGVRRVPPRRRLGDVGAADRLPELHLVEQTLDGIQPPEPRGLGHGREQVHRLGAAVGRDGERQAVGPERGHLAPHPVVVDVGHVEAQHDQVRAEAEPHVQEEQVLENRRVARHPRIHDLDRARAAAAVEQGLELLGHRLRHGEAEAFGERVAEHQDPEHPGRLARRILTVLQAERIDAKLDAAPLRGIARPQSVVQHRVGIHISKGRRRTRPPARHELGDRQAGGQPDEPDQTQANRPGRSLPHGPATPPPSGSGSGDGGEVVVAWRGNFS